MTQLNINMTAEFERDLAALMKARKIKQKSDAIRYAVAAAARAERKRRDFSALLGALAASKPNDKPRKVCPRRTRPRRLRQSKQPLPARGKREVLSPRSTRRSGATKARWQLQQPLGSFFPMPPAPARQVQRLDRVQRVTTPHRLSRRVG